MKFLCRKAIQIEALSALEVLGFVRKYSEKIVEKIVKEDPEASVESIIKKALKNL